jgi:hypothetical protein
MAVGSHGEHRDTNSRPIFMIGFMFALRFSTV